MDKMRAQVDSLAQQANAGMAKLDNMPVQRKSDALLRSLGVAVLAERTGRGNPATSSEIDRLITEITQHESQNNIDIVQQSAQAAAQAQARGQMGQMGPGSYVASSPSATNPNVAGTMPGAGAGYGPPSGFPDAGQPQPQPQPFTPPQPFPGSQQQPQPFPGSPPPPLQQQQPFTPPQPFPGSEPQPFQPPPPFAQQQPQSFPPAAGPTAFPQSVPVAPFPSADAPTGFPPASPVQEPLTEPTPQEGQPEPPA